MSLCKEIGKRLNHVRMAAMARGALMRVVMLLLLRLWFRRARALAAPRLLMGLQVLKCCPATQLNESGVDNGCDLSLHQKKEVSLWGPISNGSTRYVIGGGLEAGCSS